jgi:signal transduction histidine kinase
MRGERVTPGSVARPRPGVVGRDGDPALVRSEWRGADLLTADEADLVAADEDGSRAHDYLGRVTFRRSRRRRAGHGAPVAGDARAPLALAVGLLVAGELEVALAHDGVVSALAVPFMTLPVAWSRRAPLAALAAIAAALLAQAALGGDLVGQSVTTVLTLAVALYAAGRYAGSLAAAAALAAVLAATRVAFDPAAGSPRDALLTGLAVACPLLVGRWVRGQGLLQRELLAKADREARDRDRAARQAAEEERARIAADLQVAVAGGLAAVARDADDVKVQLRAGDAAAARARLDAIAAAARAALADVRRVLGVLRHEGEPPPLAPPGPVRPPAPASPLPVPPVAQAVTRRIAERGLDRLLAAVVVAGGAVELASASEGAPLTAALVGLPLLWRRRLPLAAALAVLAAIALQSALTDLGSFPVADMAAMVTALYALGAYGGRREGVAGVVVLAAGAVAHAAAFYPDGVAAALLGGVVLPWTVGRVVRGHRRLTEEGREKSAAAERRRVRDAHAAVTSERIRVARELHDAVAHNLSVIAIQAGGADGIAERDPERAARVAELIASVAREALAELQRLAGLPAAGTAPSLAGVARLVGRAREEGLDVALQVDGAPVALPAGVDLAAFRIVQEALANTAKHAGAGHAWVHVRYAPRAVELEIGDDGTSHGAGEGTGHGLTGMRERVGLYGGSLDAGRRENGGFLVRARLPVEAP